MDLQTGQLITRTKVVEIPITEVVINTIGKMAEEQLFKSLTFYNQKRKELFYLMSIQQECTTNNKYSKLNKKEMMNMNTK